MLSCSFAIPAPRRRAPKEPTRDRYAAIAAIDAVDHDGGRKRRLTKLNAMAENLEQRRERHSEAAPGEAELANRRGRP